MKALRPEGRAGGRVLRREGQEGQRVRHHRGASGRRAAALPLVYPVTTEALEPPLCFGQTIMGFYDDAADRILRTHLERRPRRRAVIFREGDPFFYGSYMYFCTTGSPRAFRGRGRAGRVLDARRRGRAGCRSGYRNQSLSVLSGVLPEDELPASSRDAETRRRDEARAQLRQGAARARRSSASRIARCTSSARRWAISASCRSPKSIRWPSPYFSLLVVPGEKWQG